MKLKYIFFLLTIIGCQSVNFLKAEKLKIERLYIAGKELLKLTPETKPYNPVEDIVRVGPSLFEIITTRKSPIDSIRIEIKEGDFFNEDRGVTHTMYYITNHSKIGLRIKYDPKIDKFHIVGYSGLLE